MKTHQVLLSSLLVCPALSAQPESVAAPPLASVVRVFHGADELAPDALWQRLRAADVVFLGETHLDETTHRFELAALEALAAGDRPVVLAMEMFERDDQPALDDYVGGRIDEAEFVHRTMPWGNYRTDYRPLVEAARGRGVPVVGSNLPVGLRRQLAFGGREAFERLGAAERQLLPPELLPNTEAYWARVQRATRGHMGGGGTTDPAAMLYSVQSLWDNCMGWSCAQALQQHPGAIVLHVNGGFHTQHHDGTARQLALRAPDAAVVTVDIATTDDLAGLHVTDDDEPDRADYLVFAEARARGLDEGTHAVDVARELEFRLQVPPSATDAAPVPLLVWLGDDGLRSEETLAYWQQAVGDVMAVAAVEPPFVETEDDLHLGGRWFRDDRFRQDLGPLRDGVDALCRYIARRYPVDAGRLVVGGDGTGATVVASMATWSDELGATLLAAAPRRHHPLGDQGLPDPRARAGRLLVLAEPADAEWWRGEVEAYREIGVDGAVAEVSADPLAQRITAEAEVRSALGVPAAPAATGPGTLLVVETDSPLARHWALVAARTLPGAVLGIAPATDWRAAAAAHPDARVVPLSFAALPPTTGVDLAAPFGAADLADGRALPVYPGPFGGSTVLVVPAGTPAAAREAIQQLGRDDVIKRKNRFARLYVACDEGGPGLAEVLESIRAAGRRNALVVPVAWCADAARMRELRAQAAPFAADLELAWLPGLGGELGLR